jgi:hypothetical protein
MRVKERTRERAKQVIGQRSLSPFIGKVGGKVFIILLVGFVFTRKPLEATNGS